MIKRPEAIIICPKCDEKVGEVFAVATEDRPDVWMNQTVPLVIPKQCPHCDTITERAR